ncbi:glutathione S-transferase 1-like [Plodia interpunctella]|uniref:glutathione S-transferase 1-like n=1 Tax=Plodia interpunctella TaxID=58824 RepID=UPI0023683FCA|nr:glutathione S-transferase 1-like [Plodia interpunctella]XP_053625361.1 glutathione S-transferase 1-like [Plodia interpunctella]XP_053625363.1 glutathione S-transferase 1-like [Plodia interpunctella]
MSKLLLYAAPASPPSRSVMMLAEVLGLPLQCKMINLLKLEHRTQEFKKLNPLSLVPVLQDGDFILCDSHAILKYLVSAYGGQQQEVLYPRELQARALVDQRLFFNASVFFRKVVNDIAFSSFQGRLKAPTQQHIDNIDEVYSVLDGYLQKCRYVAGDRLTIADLSVGASATAAQIIHKIDAERYPHGAAWLARLQKEPVFQKVNAPGVELLSKILNSFWEKNNA